MAHNAANEHLFLLLIDWGNWRPLPLKWLLERGNYSTAIAASEELSLNILEECAEVLLEGIEESTSYIVNKFEHEHIRGDGDSDDFSIIIDAICHYGEKREETFWGYETDFYDEETENLSPIGRYIGYNISQRLSKAEKNDVDAWGEAFSTYRWEKHCHRDTSYDYDFWRYLHRLIECPENWAEVGLSNNGYKELSALIEECGLELIGMCDEEDEILIDEALKETIK